MNKDFNAAFEAWFASAKLGNRELCLAAFRAGWDKHAEPAPAPLCWRNPPPQR